MRIILDQSEKRFISRLTKNGKNRSDLIRSNPRQLSEWIRTNPNPSFQSDQSKLGLIQTEFSIRIIRIIPTSDSFGLILIENSIWINRSILYCFPSNELQNDFRIGPESFALARIQISEWIGIVLIGSE